eukprot:scaffold7101_cov153-Amphora_coffeaeformis.AAC.5
MPLSERPVDIVASSVNPCILPPVHTYKRQCCARHEPGLSKSHTQNVGKICDCQCGSKAHTTLSAVLDLARKKKSKDPNKGGIAKFPIFEESKKGLLSHIHLSIHWRKLTQQRGFIAISFSFFVSHRIWQQLEAQTFPTSLILPFIGRYTERQTVITRRLFASVTIWFDRILLIAMTLDRRLERKPIDGIIKPNLGCQPNGVLFKGPMTLSMPINGPAILW